MYFECKNCVIHNRSRVQVIPGSELKSEQELYSPSNSHVAKYHELVHKALQVGLSNWVSLSSRLHSVNGLIARFTAKYHLDSDSLIFKCNWTAETSPNNQKVQIIENSEKSKSPNNNGGRDNRNSTVILFDGAKVGGCWR